jgi:predicted negative regulator of RcsB-dependent stress response
LLGEHLIEAGRLDEALSTLGETEKEAEVRGFFKELARLRSARVRALVHRGEAPATIEPHMAALREGFAATDSPLLVAATLLDLALKLPPLSAIPDPLTLAEEAHGLFVSMPMPTAESHCLEATGDILLARERASEAKRRYLAARARLKQYGLGLRLPLLTRKLDALG